MSSKSLRILTAGSITLTLSSLLLCSCAPGTSATGGGSSTTYSTQIVTGDWVFGPSDPPSPPPPFGGFTGALSGSGASITGTFRSLGCVSTTEDIHFTGSETAAGTLTLTSTDLPNNVVTITADLAAYSGSGPRALGSISVSGSGPCAYADTAMRAYEYPPLTGSYSGTLTAATGATATYTASLTESPANADGLFPVSGTITFSSGSCSTTYTTSGLVAGAALAGGLYTTAGPTAGGIGATLASGATQTPFSLNLSSGCATGLFTGYLGAQ